MQQRTFHNPTAATLLGLVAAGAILSGCTGPSTNAVEKPTTLTLLHVDGEAGLDPAVGWFTQRVAELSDGDITVDVDYLCCGKGHDVEEQLVNRVADGRGQLGWVGTRVFDTVGVLGLRALTAPMLIDSYPLEKAVIESGIAAKGLAELDELGVRGLAIMPGELRKPLSSVEPVRSRADWAGKKAVAFHSRLNAQTLTSLGAVPLDLSFEDRDAGLSAGSIQVAENSLRFQNGNRVQMLPYATVNVSLWPRISALIANPDALASLNKSQVEVLVRAAKDTAARTGDFAKADSGFIGSSCTAGGRFAEASAAQLAELTKALAPVYRELEKDAVTQRMMADIRALKGEVDPGPALQIPQGCRGPDLPRPTEPKKGVADFR
jgi:TRAP-type transport system periplasmic protein